MSFILALDQGTTSSRALVFDHAGTVRGLAQKEFRQFFPAPGLVELDAEEIRASRFENDLQCTPVNFQCGQGKNHDDR